MGRPRLDPAVRVQKHIQLDENGCWLWTGKLDRQGYGRITLWIDGAPVERFAHRYSYETFQGEIPPRLTLDQRSKTPSAFRDVLLELACACEVKAAA